MKSWKPWLYLLLAPVVLFALALVGMQRLPWSAVTAGPLSSDQAALIFWQLRLPRVLTAFIAGAALSVGGMCFQAVFRNPLATPYTLGVSSGAALGAALYLQSGLAAVLLPFGGPILAAFVGGLLTIGLVYGLTCLRRGFSSETLLLSGIAVSFFFASLILLIQYLSDPSESYRIVRWMMGSVQTVGYAELARLLPFVLVGGAMILAHIRELNLIMLGEELAGSRGVDVLRTRKRLFIGVSLMVGAVVAYCGPIGFVGMIIPHSVRMLTGADHSKLGPYVVIAGGLFLALADTAARTILAPSEMPVGILTALCGGPFFVALLLRKGLRF